MSLQIGQQLGSYEITSLIGKGGMGEVYRARDSKLKRDVAIKALPDEFSRDHDRLIRFQREAEVLASLNHSNIASIYDLQEANESRFLIMELVEGETLAERISRGPLPLEETLDIAKQICDALEAAHEKGIIHRDLKPGNVKILPDGKVKVLDFGLAKSMETVPASTASSNSPTLMSVAVTNAAVILGTAAYMSPEQAKGMNVDRRTDIFAFGAVVYEMLTGSQAFPGETVGDILAAVIRGEPDWSRLPVETSATLQRLLRHCLQKDPKRRFHDIADARIELEAFVLTTGFTTLASSPSMSTARRSQRAVALAVLAIAGLLATWILGREFYGARTAGDGVAYRASIPIPEGMSLFGGIASPLRLALSSDGRQIAFVISESASNRRGLWVRKVDEATARPLSGTEGADSPFWSPDGRFIAYRAQNKLWTINVSGGPPLMLADALAVPGGVGGAWNRDDVILFTPKSGAPLHRIAASGGTSVPVTKLDMEYGENTHRFPHFLPDGRHFLYLAAGSKSGGPNDPHGLFVASLDPNEPARKVSSQGVNAQFALDHLIFVRDGTLVAQLFDTRQMQLLGGPIPLAERIAVGGNLRETGGFAVSITGVLIYESDLPIPSQLGWFDRAGKLLSNLGEPADQMFPELSSDGTRVAVSMLDTARNTRDIWIYNVTRGLRTRFTTEPTDERRAVWSPDGDSIAFSSRRKGSLNLYQKSSNGVGTETALIEDNLDKSLSSWSPDGRFIVYGTSGFSTPQQGSSDIWLLPLFGDRKPTIPLRTEFAEQPQGFSPDGRWLAYTSNESGRIELYVQRFPGPEGKVQVSTAGVFAGCARWRRDGKELFYLSPDNKLMVATVNGEGAAFKVDAVRPLFEIRGVRGPYIGFNDSVFDVSPDGQRFLINMPVTQTVSAPINLVVNWPALLRR